MEEYKLNFFELQLFAEGEGDEDTDTGDQEDIDDTNIGPDDDAGEDGEPTGDPLALPGKLGLKDGRLEYIDEDDDGDAGEGGEKEKQETGTEQKKTSGDDDGEKKPSFYSPEELSLADITKLDPARIPPEAMPFYRALVASQVKPPETKETEKKKEEPARDDEAESDNTAALQEVAKILAKKGEEYDPFSAEHQALLFQQIAKMDRAKTDVATQNQVREAEQKQTYELFAAEIAAAQKTDGADFEGIDKLAAEHLQTLPYQKAAPVAAAIQRLSQNQLTKEDIPIIKGYWEDCRREYFAKKTGVSKEPKKVPPQTLKPGNDTKETKERFNAKDLGDMNQDERIEYYKRTGFADRIANLG
ncbi:hypothetical protein [Sporomusa termitida]|uniref:Uncharacterized protein n=1 Tax=Sporomusa termitida TaxID=2377 RepID=A0A517DSG4_9FIRM|nr:hypothetical protein [Sporomusa termitida]QDR80226.1 hypothetical protein SPTER_15450 [Sporomusa termitida]